MEKKSYKVSILVPIYGVEKYISKCANSLFGQSYDNIEFVFVDDCTPDNSIKVLQEVLELYPHRKASVKIVRHEFNQGLSAARNTALDNSTGDYVMHVDSDDYLDEKAVEACVESAIKTSADVVRLAITMDYGERKVDWNFSVTNKDEYLRQILRREVPITVWGILYKKDMLIKSGVRSIDGISFGEDYCTLPRIIFNSTKVSYVENVKYNYLMFNTNSLTARYSHKTYLDAINTISTLENFFFSNGREKFRNEFQIGALGLLFDLLIDCIKNNNKEDWNILQPYLKYDISLIQSLKIRWALKLMKRSKIEKLSKCYNFFKSLNLIK